MTPVLFILDKLLECPSISKAVNREEECAGSSGTGLTTKHQNYVPDMKHKMTFLIRSGLFSRNRSGALLSKPQQVESADSTAAAYQHTQDCTADALDVWKVLY